MKRMKPSRLGGRRGQRLSELSTPTEETVEEPIVVEEPVVEVPKPKPKRKSPAKKKSKAKKSEEDGGTEKTI